MPMPRHTRDLLTSGPWTLPGNPDEECQGAVHHSPTPMVVHAVPVIAPEWDARLSRESEVVHLCGLCRDNLLLAQHILLVTQGRTPWAVRREFGNRTREIAVEAWEQFVSMRHPARAAVT